MRNRARLDKIERANGLKQHIQGHVVLSKSEEITPETPVHFWLNGSQPNTLTLKQFNKEYEGELFIVKLLV